MSGSIKQNSTDDEKSTPHFDNGVVEAHYGDVEDPLEENEVFKKTHEGVDFRTAVVIFATGVLRIPSAMYSLGSLGGALSVIAWRALNTDTGAIQGDFRNAHAGCHSIADIANVLGGLWLKEAVGFLFLIAYILCAGSGILGVSIGLNALSTHAACTAGFVSIFLAVFIVVVAITTLDRPAAALQTGNFDLGYHVIGNPTFIAGITATATIEKVSYGIGLIGLIVSATLHLHVAAKYLFVRILRNTKYLQSNTWVHWTVCLGCTFGLSSLSFILAEAIPIFNFLIALTSSICFAPLAIMLPGACWMYDHAHYRSGSIGQKALYAAHCFLPVLGLFLCVSGTYGVVQSIINAYADGEIGGAFSCADNSNST
ncbi:hypothetical protein G7Y89_g8785 [Cudoniella acicularis]|uniref:Amino acid transporter transmembrane domain-containing protein n=1 Tax=Cudoniella acicularis TaxID=354080 RepID=A0A8H4RJN0_9HELO|nr:hypothetical protein G7Y89_g8785 [Cudoniella acicularis]